MKKHRLVYWNDFRDEYPATPIQDDDGDWYKEEEVNAALAAKDREIAELRADAERYRYIRDEMPRPVEGQVVWMRRGDDLDDAVDAAMKERT